MKDKNDFDQVEDSCGDVSLDDTLMGDPWSERIASKDYDGLREHPTPEQLFIREAIKHLTPKRKRVWEMYAYDRLTEEQIGEQLGVSHQAIHKQLVTIEHQVRKFVKQNRGAYMLLKLEQKIDKGE